MFNVEICKRRVVISNINNESRQKKKFSLPFFSSGLVFFYVNMTENTNRYINGTCLEKSRTVIKFNDESQESKLDFRRKIIKNIFFGRLLFETKTTRQLQK